MKKFPSISILINLVVSILLLAEIQCFKINSTAALKYSSKISQSLVSKLTSDTSVTADILVSLKVGTGNILQKFNSENNLNGELKTRESKIESIVSVLEHHAEVTQKNVLDFLGEIKINSINFQSFWITNQILVKKADLELVFGLAELEDVGKIEVNDMIHLIEPIKPQQSQSPKNIAWGVESIEAPQVWSLNGGNAGERVIVATIDTGVRWTHEALKNNYIGTYGWYDPYSRTKEPNDQNGHGTHVTGTIVGTLGIGVAPNATWMSCKGCGPDSCYIAQLIECGQFVMCPTLTDGTGRDCTKAAHIVSNSWAGGQGNNFYAQVIEAWHIAGIIPVFGIGNEGPQCSTASSPGDSPDVIAVGATTELNEVSWFSGLGPSLYGTIKPDISAPGSNIKSAYMLSDNSYALMSGTSMACPHVTGVITLLISAYPGINYEEIKSFIYNAADQNLKGTESICGGIKDSEYPNNMFGHGKVNAINSIKKLLEYLGDNTSPTSTLPETTTPADATTPDATTIETTSPEATTPEPTIITDTTPFESTLPDVTTTPTPPNSTTPGPEFYLFQRYFTNSSISLFKLYNVY